MSPRLYALLSICPQLVLALVHSFRQEVPLCDTEPRWHIDNEDLLSRYAGNVTVLVTMNLHDDINRHLLQDMRALAEHIQSHSQLAFIIVAPATESQQWLSLWRSELSAQTNMQVHKETIWSSVWHTLNSDERDVFVYDRCGRLAYKIGAAHSRLSEKHHVASAIYNTLNHQPCGFCGLDPRHQHRQMGAQVPEPDENDAIEFYRRYRLSMRPTAPAPVPSKPIPTTASFVGSVVVSMRTRSVESNQRMTGRSPDVVYTQMGNSRNRNWPSSQDQTTIQPYYHYPDRRTQPSPTTATTQNNYYYQQTTPPIATTQRNYYYQDRSSNYQQVARPTPAPQVHPTTETFVRRPLDYDWFATTTPPRTTTVAPRFDPVQSYRYPYSRADPPQRRPSTTSTYAPARHQITGTSLPWQTATEPLPAPSTSTSPDPIEIYRDLINPKIPSECYKTDPLTFEKYLMYSDRVCFEMQSTPASSSPEFQKCCYKGVYLTDVCTQANCQRAGDNSYKMCCLQKLIQAKWRCCNSADLSGAKADEFSRCCYEHLVWFEGDSNCCPKEFAEQYWSQKSSLYQVCMPNVRVDYSSLTASMPNQSGDDFVLRMADVRHAWNFDCPYAARNEFAYYYQPPAINITVITGE